LSKGRQLARDHDKRTPTYTPRGKDRNSSPEGQEDEGTHAYEEVAEKKFKDVAAYSQNRGGATRVDRMVNPKTTKFSRCVQLGMNRFLPDEW